MGAENNLIRDFERENNIMLDAEKQIKREEREKNLEMEMQQINNNDVILVIEKF